MVNELPPQSLNQSDSSIMEIENMNPDLKKEFAYDIMTIKREFEDNGLWLQDLVKKLVDIVNNAYKLSAKDTPYDDYETRLKGVGLIMRAMGIGKPQQVYNVLNMFAKPPQMN